MVVAGIAFSLVFTYKDFMDCTKSPIPLLNNIKQVSFTNLIITLQQVLSVKDLIKDAKTTFVDDVDEFEQPLKVILSTL